MDQMDNVIRFPKAQKPMSVPVSAVAPAPAEKSGKSLPQVIGEVTWAVVWGLCFMLWRIVRWPYAVFCAFQFLRMLIHWDTPGMHAGLTFLGYFAVLVIGENFPLFFRPKLFDDK